MGVSMVFHTNRGYGLFSKKMPLSFLLRVSFLFMIFFIAPTGQSHACFCFVECASGSCSAGENEIENQHDDLRENTKDEFDDDLGAYEDWLVDVFLAGQVVPAMADMATQMAAVAMQYTQIIGSFLDAQIQMDTQRLFRKLQYDAHKDYRPSEDFCWFGTNVASMAATNAKARFNALALSQIAMDRHTGVLGSSGAEDADYDYKARWEQFVDTYCDRRDNNRQSDTAAYGGVVGASVIGTPATTGLELACDHDGPGGSTTAGAETYNRINRDIDYTRLIEEPRALDVDFTDNTLNTSNILIVAPVLDQPGDEEDVLAMSKNLYGAQVLTRSISRKAMSKSAAQRLYLALRSVAAKRSVAQASYNAIVGLKSVGSSYEQPNTTVGIHPSAQPVVMLQQKTLRFMAAIMDQLLPASPANIGNNIFDILGYSPSYYSQLEILAKRIYQNPDFYANLYDTPANVSRKKVAMRAIELMVDREIYESQLRKEMSVSVLLAAKLRQEHRSANKRLAVGSAEGQ